MNKEKKRNLLHRIELILIIGLTIFNLVFYFLYFKYNYENNLIIKEVSTNLNGKLINSIALRKLCLDGEEKLILGTWDGTNSGCNCNETIDGNFCSLDKIKSGCKIVEAIKPINYTIFKSNYICVKRTKLKYRDYLKSSQVIPNDKECSSGNKLCGIIDTFGRKLCVSEKEECPLNSINIVNKLLNLNENETIHDGNGKLITTIKLFQYLPCINPLEKYWNNYYILEPPEQRCTTEINGELYDDRYEKINDISVNKLQLYQENSILNKLKLDKETLNILKYDIIYLFVRNFLGFETNALKKYDYNLLISNEKRSNTCNIIQLVVDIVVLLSIVIYIVVKFQLCCCCKKETSNNIMELLKYFYNSISFCILCLFYFIISIIILVSYVKIKSILNIKGDNIFNEFIKIKINEISFNFVFSLIAVIISPIFFIILIIIAFIKPSKSDIMDNNQYSQIPLLNTTS